jgi:hypothetical protein
MLTGLLAVALGLYMAGPALTQEIRTVELSHEGVTILSYGIVELFDVNMPVTLHFSFNPDRTTELAGKLIRQEKDPDPRMVNYDALETRYSGRISNALGDEPTTIIWTDQTPEWLALFTPTVYPAPDDGRIYMELQITVRWKEPSTVSPDAGLYTSNLLVSYVDEPEAVPAWANIYPDAFMRSVPRVLARDPDHQSTQRAFTVLRERLPRSVLPTAPAQRVYGAITRSERMERLDYLRALQRAQK